MRPRRIRSTIVRVARRPERLDSAFAASKPSVNSFPKNCEANGEAPYSFMQRCPLIAPWAEVWRVDCGGEARFTPPDVLSVEELVRAREYRFTTDCRAFVLRRSALRALIGRHFECEPKSIRFSRNAYGKLMLAWPRTNTAFSFSVASTAGCALLVIAQCDSVGVDVERVRYDIDFWNIGRMVFAEPELAWLMGCDRNTLADRFFRLWTRKEAYLKALGWGFMRDPRLFSPTGFDSEIPDAGINVADTSVPTPGEVFALPLGKSLRGSLAVA